MMMVQLGRGSRTSYGSYVGALPYPPSRRLVMQWEGQRTRALVLSEVECMLGKKPVDASDK